MFRLATQAAAIACALLLLQPAALAQTYPSRSITLIVSFPPGASADIVARTLEPRVSAELGQSLVIENRPGAGGNIGIGAVAKAQPDGYTLGIAAAGVLAVNPHINRNMPFDPLKDLVPITMLAEIPFVLAASPTVPVASVADVMALAKSSPDKLSIGHGGNGTAMHLTAALFTQKAQVKIPLVAYRGSAPAANDLLGGHIALAVLDVTTSLQLIQEGKLKALGVSAAKRVALLPQVPTLAEQGLEGYEFVGWFGLVSASRHAAGGPGQAQRGVRQGHDASRRWPKGCARSGPSRNPAPPRRSASSSAARAPSGPRSWPRPASSRSETAYLRSPASVKNFSP